MTELYLRYYKPSQKPLTMVAALKTLITFSKETSRSRSFKNEQRLEKKQVNNMKVKKEFIWLRTVALRLERQ